VKSNTATNNDRLANFKSIDTSINIDSISTENSQTSHINIIKDIYQRKWLKRRFHRKKKVYANRLVFPKEV